MKKSFRIILTLFLFITFVSIYAQTTFVYTDAESDGSNITLNWKVNENNFNSIHIYRKIGSEGDYQKLDAIIPVNYNKSLEYTFTDKNVYKTNNDLFISYKLVVDGNESNGISIIPVTHSVSSVKRTWGSIKAMFR